MRNIAACRQKSRYGLPRSYSGIKISPRFLFEEAGSALLIDAARQGQRGEFSGDLGAIFCGNGWIGQDSSGVVVDEKEQFGVAEASQPRVAIDGNAAG
jgi:hypothetical protein